MENEMLKMLLEVIVRECQETRQMAAHLLSQNERRLEVLVDLVRGKIKPAAKPPKEPRR